MIDPQLSALSSDRNAYLFDLDGVLADTQRLHAWAWKEAFDAYLRQAEADDGTPFREFDAERDYELYVDGKRRADGIRSFLTSRGLGLSGPHGTGRVDEGLVERIGDSKNSIVTEHLTAGNFSLYDDAVALAESAVRSGIRCAVVSSSANATLVLRVGGLEELFDPIVDGRVAHRQNLPSKPAPDTFRYAARILDLSPADCVVFEDSTSGVAAGRAGQFGCVVGVDRGEAGERLLGAGADLVSTDLRQFS